MTFYESVHCGVWRVSLNEQYIWSWLRANKIREQSVDVGKLADLVEDRLNLQTFATVIDVNNIILLEFQKMLNSK